MAAWDTAANASGSRFFGYLKSQLNTTVVRRFQRSASCGVPSVHRNRERTAGYAQEQERIERPRGRPLDQQLNRGLGNRPGEDWGSPDAQWRQTRLSVRFPSPLRLIRDFSSSIARLTLSAFIGTYCLIGGPNHVNHYIVTTALL